ncbi:MAG: PaaI family thioesterase [Methanomicrobiales archaeon]|nr:PaaI family thioesterase [Methanomicrobiales archaeon]
MQERKVDPDIVRAFDSCEFSRLLGMSVVDTWDGGARVVMEAGGKANAMGVAHGGAIFSLADQAFGIAANQEGVVHVAVSVHINYIAPAQGRLEAVARRVSQTEDRVLYAIRVTEGDRLIAEFEGLAWKK